MINQIKSEIWSQFGASLQMLDDAITLCPIDVWVDKRFWYITYHTLFFMDYYTSQNPIDFIPPKPFTLSELNKNYEMPPEIYSKEVLKDYLKTVKYQSFKLIQNLTEDNLKDKFKNNYIDFSTFEMLLYTFRHTQHHVGQLNMILRSEKDITPIWTSSHN